MNANYTIHPDRELIEIRYWDRMVPDVILEVFARILKDENWSPGYDIFVDMSWVTSVEINFNQMMGITHRKTPYLSKGRATRMAIWAPDDICFGTARMYAALMEPVDGVETETFRDRDEAWRFLECTESARA